MLTSLKNREAQSKDAKESKKVKGQVNKSTGIHGF